MSTTDWRVRFRGRTTCACVAEWIPVWEAMCLREGITSGFYDGKTCTIFQLTGSASASAGTHSQGGAIDNAMLDARGIRIAREMGASASWRRLWPGNLHSHMVLEGCPHNGPARYQIAAVKLGRDGLGWLGLAGKDTEHRPETWRTWREGITWARAQLAATGAATPDHPDWSDMASRAEIRAEVKAALEETLAEAASRDTRHGRNTGTSLWRIIRDAIKGGYWEIEQGKTSTDRNAARALRKIMGA